MEEDEAKKDIDTPEKVKENQENQKVVADQIKYEPLSQIV